MKVWSICLLILWIHIWTAILLYSTLIEWTGYDWKTEGKNYTVPLQNCSKLRKKINAKLYLPFTPEILDNNYNILIYNIYFPYFSILIHLQGSYLFVAYTAVIFVNLWSQLSEKLSVSWIVLLLSGFMYFYCLMVALYKS